MSADRYWFAGDHPARYPLGPFRSKGEAVNTALAQDEVSYDSRPGHVRVYLCHTAFEIVSDSIVFRPDYQLHVEDYPLP